MFGVGSNVQTLPSLGDDNDCLDIDMDLIAQLSKTENRIRIFWANQKILGQGNVIPLNKDLGLDREKNDL